ncbi:ATP-binding cassette domain-containing protein [Flavobacteriaceae bacterium]|nr:ATP-binding cassette domain-containing protein [Flavobacteriaceae bacterium]
MSEVLIKVDHLSKKFCRSLKRSMYYGVTDALKTMGGINYSTDTLRPSEFWSLNDISFELRKGETLGILGANGSGKSTLLRMLAGIFPPDHGKIEINGNIGALIAVGAGFHPHMTGFENIYLNGTILGLTKDRIDEIIDEITAFSEIPEDALNAPVATYSSGMKVRLGFSVAMHCEPDILLVDEVLSVGDIGFKNKAVRKMNEFREKANGLIFISHDLEQMRMICDRVIVLDKGKCVFVGDTEKGCIAYEEIIRDHKIKNNIKLKRQSNVVYTNDVIDLRDIQTVDSNSRNLSNIGLSDQLIILVKFKLNEVLEDLSIHVKIATEAQPFSWIIELANDYNNKKNFGILNTGVYFVKIKLDKHNLTPGVYNFGTVTFRNNKTFETHNKTQIKKIFTVNSEDSKYDKGVVNVDDFWSIAKVD